MAQVHTHLPAQAINLGSENKRIEEKSEVDCNHVPPNPPFRANHSE